ncbi:MAG TPA: GDSL-type esterase/lipase family protein, partial [Polyangiaceae bacterium]|nr:GDSL-type esterase/lipase family protein [Polyangiaceae bacterium]
MRPMRPMRLIPRTAFVMTLLAGLAGLAGAAGSALADSQAPPTPAQAQQQPPATEAPPPAKKQRYVVAAMGDSLTDARSHGGKFLNYLRERCPASQFDNYGKGGQMVNQMRKRFARDVLGEPPIPGENKPDYTHVIVFGGVNDLYSDLTAKRTPEKVAKDLLEMFAGARRKGAKVIAMTVAPWGGFKAYYNASRGARTLELNQWILAQKKAGTVDYVIDTYPMLSCGDPEQLCPSVMAPFKDGLHFGAEGHAKIGKALHDQVFSD